MQGVIRGSSLAALALLPLGMAAWPSSVCAQETSSPAASAPASSSVIPTTPITLNVESADLYYTLKLLFAQVKANFTLDTSLRGALVTARLNQVPFDIALNAILKASGQPLTYSYEDGILSIVPQTLIAETNPILSGTSSAQTGEPANTTYQKLTLSTASVYDVMYALGRPVVQIPTSYGGSGMGGSGGFGTPGIGGSYGGFGNGSNGFGNGAQGGFQGNTGGTNGFNGRGGFGQGGNGAATGGFGTAGGLIPQGVQDIFGFGPDNSVITLDP